MNKKMQEAQALQTRLGILIKTERKVLNEVLDAIIEADIHRSYAELGYTSLHHWLTTFFKYSESAAWRRIDSARMKRAVPALDEKIENGSVNLSNVARAQSAVRAEETRTKTKLTDAQKALVIEKIEGKNGFETEKILKSEFPETKIFQNERVRVLSEKEVTLQIVMTHEEYADFLRAKELLSHAVPSGSHGKIVAAVFKEYVDRKDPLRKKTKEPVSAANAPKRNSTAESADKSAGSFEDKLPQVNSAIEADRRSRHIPNPIRLEVLRRGKARCQAVIGQTGEICGSRYKVEVDHIQPFALGGTHEISNLQCLCAQHNRRRAEKTFGVIRRD